MTRLAFRPVIRSNPFSGFIRDVATVSGVQAECIERVCSRIGVPRDDALWRSTLNNDGSPIQICLNLRPGKAQPSVRVIADPYEAGDGQPPRIAQSRNALAQLAEWHAPNMASLCDSVLAHMTPSGCNAPYSREGGDAWLAAGTGGRGVAIYATARWGEPAARWPRALAWLREISPAAVQSAAKLGEFAASTTLVSVGIEGSTAGDARAKFYWRPNGSAPLAGLGVPLLAHEAFPAFLADATEGMATPVSAIVGSVGVSVASGSLADVKLDLCAHCVPRSTKNWADHINRYVHRHGLSALPLATLEPGAPVEVAFVGLGMDHDLQPRLNVYLKPIVHRSRR